MEHSDKEACNRNRTKVNWKKFLFVKTSSRKWEKSVLTEIIVRTLNGLTWLVDSCDLNGS